MHLTAVHIAEYSIDALARSPRPLLFIRSFFPNHMKESTIISLSGENFSHTLLAFFLASKAFRLYKSKTIGPG